MDFFDSFLLPTNNLTAGKKKYKKPPHRDKPKPELCRHMGLGSGYEGLMQRQRFNGRNFCVSPTDYLRHSGVEAGSAVKGSSRQTAPTLGARPWLSAQHQGGKAKLS